MTSSLRICFECAEKDRVSTPSGTTNSDGAHRRAPETNSLASRPHAAFGVLSPMTEFRDDRTTGDFPNLDGSVRGAGCDKSAIAERPPPPMKRGESFVPRKSRQTVAARDIPQLHGLVVGSGDNPTTVWGDRPLQTSLVWPTSVLCRNATRRWTVRLALIRWRAACSARSFHSMRIGTVNLASSLSINLAHDWQAQIPLVAERRASGKRVSSYRGPPDDAAVMCAATPTFAAPVS